MNNQQDIWDLPPVPGDPLDLFEYELRKRNAAKAPNGMMYRLIASDLSVERYQPGQLGEKIVGFSGTRLETYTDLIYWAVMDGRHTFTPNTPISERKLIV